MTPTLLDRRPPEPRPRLRLCTEAGAVAGADAVEDEFTDRSILGVPLDQGEIVILVLRRSWRVDALEGVIGGVVTLLAVWLIERTLGHPWPLTSSALAGLAVGSGVFVVERLRRLYVLTDRRVMSQDRRLTRIIHHQAPLACVREILLVQNDLQTRLGTGAIVFRTDEGAVVWSHVGDAPRTHRIACEALRRYGGSMRGM